jgi:hypothetical protein
LSSAALARGLGGDDDDDKDQKGNYNIDDHPPCKNKP